MKRLAMMAAAVILAAGGAEIFSQGIGPRTLSAAMTMADGESWRHGQTEPVAKVEVPAGMKGQLASVDVKQGQLVKKGDPLARLDDAIQQQTVALAQMDADSTVEVRYYQTQLDYAKVENQRFQQNPSANELEKRQKELAVKQAELAVEQYQEKQKQAAVKLKREQITLDRMTIKSPIDGFVLRVNKHEGEETDENPLAVVVQVNRLSAVFYPPKQMFGKVKVGDKVELELAMEPAMKKEALVVAVDPIIDPAGQIFQVKMELDNADAKVPAGTGATWKGK
jgi:RND family efflux transporter MFP subunit